MGSPEQLNIPRHMAPTCPLTFTRTLDHRSDFSVAASACGSPHRQLTRIWVVVVSLCSATLSEPQGGISTGTHREPAEMSWSKPRIRWNPVSSCLQEPSLPFAATAGSVAASTDLCDR